MEQICQDYFMCYITNIVMSLKSAGYENTCKESGIVWDVLTLLSKSIWVFRDSKLTKNDESLKMMWCAGEFY